MRKFAKYWRDSASLLILARDGNKVAAKNQYNYKVSSIKLRPTWVIKYILITGCQMLISTGAGVQTDREDFVHAQQYRVPRWSVRQAG